MHGEQRDMKIRMKQFGLIVLLGLLMGQAHAQTSDAAAQLTELLSGLKSLQADFHQLTLGNDGQMLQDINGQISVQRPGLFNWQANPPLAQQVVSDGKQLWQYDADLEQVVVQTVDQRFTQTPALILGGDVSKLMTAYNVTGGQNEEGWLFTLVPNSDDALFESLRLKFVADTPQEMFLTDSLGQRVSIEFSNVKVNPQLNTEQFTFVPPEGVDVLHQ